LTNYFEFLANFSVFDEFPARLFDELFWGVFDDFLTNYFEFWGVFLTVFVEFPARLFHEICGLNTHDFLKKFYFF